MANNNAVDAVIASEAIKQVQALKTELAAADAELLKLSQTAVKASKSISGISTPSGLENSASEHAKINAELEKRNAIITKLHEQIAKKAEQSRLAEIKLQQAREKAFDSYEKTSKREALIAEKNANNYNKTQAQINNLTKVYNDLAIRKERYNNLSANEEMRLNTLAKVTEKYNGILKATDATIGKNQRNVGNYASGYNALGNAVNQLTREMPAGVNSINTLFMAWSNNFPALFDALKGIKEQNKALAAEGKATVSPIKQLFGAFFSLQTLLSVGVTLLTLYGGKIIESITGSGKRKEALEKEKKAIEEKTKAEQDSRDSIASEQATEISRSKVLLETAKNLSLGYNQRVKAVKELQERYPDYLGHLSKEQILAGETAKAEEDLNNALINRGKALAAQKFLQTNLEKQLSLEIEIDKISQNELKYNLEATKNGNKLIVYTDAQKQIQQQKLDIERKSNKEKLFSLRERLSALKNEQTAFLDIYNANAKYLGVVKETSKEKEKSKTEREDVKALEVAYKSLGNTIEQLDNKIDEARNRAIRGLPKDTLAMSKEELAKYEAENEIIMKEGAEDLKILLELRKKLNALPTASTTILQPAKKEYVENMRALSTEAKAYMETFTQDFIGQSGFTNTFKILNDEIDGFGENASVTFNAIAESAQEMFNFIANASQQNFDAEYSRLESQKDIALKFAGDSTSGKKKIEDEYEKKRKEIQNRENKAKQKQAIFNIAIDTAQAVVATLPNIPLSVAIGILGAAQIAVVAAQKIPQYFDGTDNHQGGLMLVNDGKGANYREKIILPSGKQITPQGRNVLMDAPKGTRVLNHEQQIQEMLNERGISMSMATKVNNGMTAQEMDAVIGKHFSKIQTNHTVFDKKGISQWSTYNGNKTIRNQNLANGIGFNV
jgi:hypothetical protein